MRKTTPRKLTLQRETLKNLSLSQVTAARAVSNLCGEETQGWEFTCNPWYSELYSACTCPPSWWETCTGPAEIA